MNLTREQVIDWLRRAAAAIEENQEYLTELDAAIGDAEHGISMQRGFSKVLAQLPGYSGKDIGGILKSTGMVLLSSVGGVSGALYGTFFMKAGDTAAGKEELSGEDLSAALRAGLDGVTDRGRAAVGDKTMVDALQPAVEALEKAVGGGESLDEALARAADAAEQGMKDTIPLVAKKGRASYVGERSAGHQDAGATSVHLIIRTLYEAAVR